MENVKKSIVITSIFNPTQAVHKFADNKDYELIVVGDKKTPQNWQCDGVVFLGVENQEVDNFSKMLPYNHYCRKMLGYLHAFKTGAEIIVDTDDDNIPYDDWNFPEFEGNKKVIEADLGFINIYQLYSNEYIWPRGLPLQYLQHNKDFQNKIIEKEIKVGIWQGLADGEPDVDAVFRMVFPKSVKFTSNEHYVLDKKTITPFNSQNTAFVKELFPLLYLPTYVTFRYTDILRGLVAQPIMWAKNYHLGFTGATVWQERNAHNLFKDFISEVPMYTTAHKVVDIVESVISSNNSILDNMLLGYEALLKEEIVTKEELVTLEAWLKYF